MAIFIYKKDYFLFGLGGTILPSQTMPDFSGKYLKFT